jgi:benzoyl-CoA 2,3-dioxygenase component A
MQEDDERSSGTFRRDPAVLDAHAAPGPLDLDEPDLCARAGCTGCTAHGIGHGVVTATSSVPGLGTEHVTHHLMLGFGRMPFPVLAGQSIGILPPGVDALGRPHPARRYSIAGPRNGERPGHDNVSLTIKRVLEDHQGRAVRGVLSNDLCDLQVGDRVKGSEPFGAGFPNSDHPRSRVVMICTGTAPMHAMIEWRRKVRKSCEFEGDKLMLFFGARTQE